MAAVGLSRPRPQKDLGQGSVRPGPRQWASQGAGQEARPRTLLRKDRAHWERTWSPEAVGGGGEAGDTGTRHWDPQVIAGAKVEDENTHISRGSFIATDRKSF